MCKSFFKAINVLILLALQNSSFAQNRRSDQKTDINKWNHAIVNLLTKDGFNNKKWMEKSAPIVERVHRKEITREQYRAEIDLLRKQLIDEIKSYTGTAIFLKYNNRYYLITARHVVEDSNAEEATESICSEIALIENGSYYADTIRQKEKGVDLFTAPNVGLKKSYVFSSKTDDLAIIGIGPRIHQSFFLDRLLSEGYIPITIDDINISEPQVGQEITSFGFPGDLYQEYTQGLTRDNRQWASNIVSLPVISKGSVIDPQPQMNFFQGGIYVTNGNSGGAIVARNKLIGVVSNQKSPLKIVNSPNLNYYTARDLNFIKARLIIPLLHRAETNMIEAEKSYDTMRNYK